MLAPFHQILNQTRPLLQQPTLLYKQTEPFQEQTRPWLEQAKSWLNIACEAQPDNKSFSCPILQAGAFFFELNIYFAILSSFIFTLMVFLAFEPTAVSVYHRIVVRVVRKNKRTRTRFAIATALCIADMTASIKRVQFWRGLCTWLALHNKHSLLAIAGLRYPLPSPHRPLPLAITLLVTYCLLTIVHRYVQKLLFQLARNLEEKRLKWFAAIVLSLFYDTPVTPGRMLGEVQCELLILALPLLELAMREFGWDVVGVSLSDRVGRRE